MDDAATEADVVRDAIEPGAELRFRPEAGQAPPRAQERLLRQVYRFFGVARHAEGEIVDARLVPLDQPREGIVVSRLPAPDQCLLVLHRRGLWGPTPGQLPCDRHCTH